MLLITTLGVALPLGSAIPANAMLWPSGEPMTWPDGSYVLWPS